MHVDVLLVEDGRILGIAQDAIARACPVRLLNWHEIVTDRLGETPIAVTCGPLCGTAIAFDARLGAQVASFGVSRLLYNSDVLLYDRRTRSPGWRFTRRPTCPRSPE
jgi:hypothetical protein